MQKSMLSVDGDDLTIAFNFTKVDPTTRTVTGIATANNVDQEGDVIEYEASKEAFSKWLGNIREMHGSKAVGKAIKVEEVEIPDVDGQLYKGFKVTAYISKGAQDTWEKCVDGTLAGFSVGGRVIKKSREFHKTLGTMVSRITKYALTELSVVDNPCNQLAAFSLVKANSAGELKLTEQVSGSTVFYCDTDEIAKFDEAVCPSCSNLMHEIGYVETITVEELNKVLGDYALTKNIVQGVSTAENSGPNSNTIRDMADEDLDTTEKVEAAIEWYNTIAPDAAGRYTAGDWIQLGQKIADAATMVLGIKHVADNGRVVAEATNDIPTDGNTKPETAALAVSKVTNTHNTPPAGYPKNKDQYADPNNFKYPVDTRERAMAAMRYYNQGNQQAAGGYTGDEWDKVGNKIVSAVTSYTGNQYHLNNGNIVPVKGGKINKMTTDLLNNNIGVNNEDIDLTPKQKLGIFKQLATWLVGIEPEEITKEKPVVETTESITKATTAEDQNETEGEEMDAETLSKLVSEAVGAALTEKLSKVVTEPVSAYGESVGNSGVSGFSTDRLQEFFGELKDLAFKVESIGKRLDDIEKATAGKKSVAAMAEDAADGGADDADEDKNGKPMKKAASAKFDRNDPHVWGNVFLPQQVVESLGYES